MLDEIRDIGRRLRGMREILDVSESEMAGITGVTEAEYRESEAGERDFSFTFLYRAATRLGIDMTELLTGESPHLSGYALTRKGNGLPIERRIGFKYHNLAALFRARQAEPFLVTAPYETGAETCELQMSTHEGQEMDYVLAGTLRIRIGNNEETLHEGDSIYYDSSQPHGMAAVGQTPCRFLAIVMNKNARR